MLFRRWINEMPSRTLISLGIGLFVMGVMLVSINRLLIGLPDLWSGFMFGLGSVMIGTSTVLNLRGLVRARAERIRNSEAVPELRSSVGTPRFLDY